MRAPRSGAQRMNPPPPPASMPSTSKTAGRSKITTRRSVTTKSCIITGAGRSTGVDHVERAVGRRAVHADVGRERAVAEEHHLARLRVDLGVGGHGSGQRPAEVVLAHRVEVGGDLGGRRTLHQRQHPPGVADDVGVGRVLHHPALGDDLGVGQPEVGQARVQGAAGPPLGGEAARAHPAVPVARPALVERDAVQHAVAVEEVVAAERRERRVRPVAEEGPPQRRRELAGDGQAVGVELVVDRFVQPGEPRLGRRLGVGRGAGPCVGPHRHAAPYLAGEQCSPARGLDPGTRGLRLLTGRA